VWKLNPDKRKPKKNNHKKIPAIAGIFCFMQEALYFSVF
jgi:hypothetical protein